MRFSIGVGVGPVRATQNIGVPRVGGSGFNPVKGVWLLATDPHGATSIALGAVIVLPIWWFGVGIGIAVAAGCFVMMGLAALWAESNRALAEEARAKASRQRIADDIQQYRDARAAIDARTAARVAAIRGGQR